MLEWRYSDGDVSRRPPGVSFVSNKDKNGNVNFYRPIPDTEEASVTWRREIGTYIAGELKLPRKFVEIRITIPSDVFECSGKGLLDEGLAFGLWVL